MNKNFFRKFGCLKDPEDKRDLLFSTRHVVAELPAIVEWPKRVGHGTSAAFRNALLFNGQPDFIPSRQMAYYIARRCKKRDTGAYIRDAIKAGKKYGICPENMWPYTKENIFKKPTKNCYKEALNHQILKYERINPIENEIKSAIAAGFGVVFGIDIYSSFMSSKVERTGVVPIPSIKEEYYGGHCMFMAAYNSFYKDYFDVLNSWGLEWGDKGRCHLPVEYVMEHANDLWAVYLTE
jgi:C1A family cysteine protease